MKAEELEKSLKRGEPPTVVDVRSRAEFASGHIPGAIQVPFLTAWRHRSELPQDPEAPIVLTCEHGPRAVVAKALLARAGYRNLDLLEGHMSLWRRSGRTMER